MNELTRLESELKKIENIYLEKKKNLIIDDSNHFTMLLSYQLLSKEFVEKEVKCLINFTNELINKTDSELIQKELKEKTEYFLTSFPIDLSIE